MKNLLTEGRVQQEAAFKEELKWNLSGIRSVYIPALPLCMQGVRLSGLNGPDQLHSPKDKNGAALRLRGPPGQSAGFYIMSA